MFFELIVVLVFCCNLFLLFGIVLCIIELVQDLEVDIVIVVDIIVIDMVLSVCMLCIVNLLLYVSCCCIENFGQVLIMLGLNVMISFVFGFIVIQGLIGGIGVDYDLCQCVWKCSIFSVLVVSQLGQVCGLCWLEELMLVGLLQDLGVLCLVQVELECYLLLLCEVCDNIDLVVCECEELGCSYVEVGVWVVE